VNELKPGSLSNLPPGERIEIISHGNADVMRFGKSAESPQSVAATMAAAKPPPGSTITVVACQSATPGASGQSTVQAISGATGCPTQGIARNPGSTDPLGGLGIVRGSPNPPLPRVPASSTPGFEPGTVDIRDGHWAQSTGGAPAQAIPPPAGMGTP